MMKPTELIVALDVDTTEQALTLVETLGQQVVWYKVGKQLFTGGGPEVVRRLREGYGKKVFLDLKFHDIPNTVGRAVARAGQMGVEMTNVHAGGGSAMLRAAAEAAAESELILVAVTVLTSLDTAAMKEVGWNVSPEEQVLRLARLSARAGVDGVVCSACEVALLREEMDPEFRLVVPGIRPKDKNPIDQKRVMTPAQAVQAGADYIVVGRPITEDRHPEAAASGILAEMMKAIDLSTQGQAK